MFGKTENTLYAKEAYSMFSSAKVWHWLWNFSSSMQNFVLHCL